MRVLMMTFWNFKRGMFVYMILFALTGFFESVHLVHSGIFIRTNLKSDHYLDSEKEQHF